MDSGLGGPMSPHTEIISLFHTSHEAYKELLRSFPRLPHHRISAC